MVTFTLPYELRSLAWQHQKTVYSALFAYRDVGKGREHKHMDVRRYASMDGGGTTPRMGEVESSLEQRPRAASGTKAESNAGAVA